MQIDHINIKAPPALLEEVRDFYCEVLGLQEGARPEFASKGYWLYSAAGPIVHLSVVDESPRAGAGGQSTPKEGAPTLSAGRPRDRATGFGPGPDPTASAGASA